MKIIWDKVTQVSQIVAIVLFLLVLFLGFYIGRRYEDKIILGNPIASAIFSCAEGKTINTEFYPNLVHIKTSKLGSMYLSQTISASGARYADAMENVVFWNKGNTAFVTEGSSTNVTYKDCITK